MLIYLYGIVPAATADPPAALLGIDGSPVRLLRLGEVAAIVSEVPAEIYADDPLNSRLDDLGWVGQQGMAHEQVLDWFAEQGPVIPLSLFSLHQNEARVEARVGQEADDYAQLLERLTGRQEWGVKLWRREAEAKTGIDRLSTSLQALAKEIEAAPPGKRYLLERKRDAMRTEELRTVSKRLAHELLAALRPLADGAVSVPLPSDVRGERILLLHAALLVPTAGFEPFHKAVSEQAAGLTEAGFEIELTGPWPPYHFTEPPDDG